MGCLQSVPERDEDTPPKQYSWDIRKAADTANLEMKGHRGEKIARAPGTVDGNQFLIADCQDCDIFVLDNSAVVTVDDCVNCTIFLGPITGSVFIRDTTNCRFVIACQQFRTRDCKDIDCLLLCNTLPIIEATSSIRFGCFRGSYFTLAGQFSKSGISLYNNNWGKIHDFTPETGNKNFSFLDRTPDWLEPFFSRRPESVSEIEIDLDPITAAVPVTLGPLEKPSTESCFVVIFKPRLVKKMIQAALRAAELKPEIGFAIIQTKETTMEAQDAKRVFPGDSQTKFVEAASGNPVVGIEFCGDKCVSVVHAAAASMGDALLYISADSDTGKSDIEAFYNFTELSMKV